MNISLPDGLKKFVDTHVGSRSFCTSSEYASELIRENQDRQQLRGLLLAGAQSAPSAPVDATYFNRLHKRISCKKSNSSPMH